MRGRIAMRIHVQTWTKTKAEINDMGKPFLYRNQGLILNPRINTEPKD